MLMLIAKCFFKLYDAYLQLTWNFIYRLILYLLFVWCGLLSLRWWFRASDAIIAYAWCFYLFWNLNSSSDACNGCAWCFYFFCNFSFLRLMRLYLCLRLRIFRSILVLTFFCCWFFYLLDNCFNIRRMHECTILMHILYSSDVLLFSVLTDFKNFSPCNRLQQVCNRLPACKCHFLPPVID